MIRPTRDDDHDGLIKLATASGLFNSDQTEMLSRMLRAPSDTDTWFTDDVDGLLVGVAYLAPEKMIRGTWNLLSKDC